MRRKIRSRRYPGVRETMVAAGAASLGGAIGAAFPGTAGAPLTGAAGGFASMVKPMAATSGAAMVMSQLHGIRRKARRR